MITLSSDFGSPYPAAMKGVICRLTDARLVDVSHEFPRQDVGAAAFWLREVLPYFPPATHLVVVDPGVGTDRNALVVRAGDHALIGPDNGVLLPPARALADDAPVDVFVLDDGADSEGDSGPLAIPDAPRGRSNTFHGRDVFAPLAAVVHETSLADLGYVEGLSLAVDHVDLRLPQPTFGDERAVGEVLVVDGFGNVITNVPGRVLDDADRIVANGRTVPVGETFADVLPGQPLATVGSHGYVELDVNQGRGDETFGLASGDEVALEFSL